MDPKSSPVPAAPRHVGEVVVLEAKDWTGAEEALSKLAHASLNRRRPPPGSDFSAGPRATEPPLDATLRTPDLKIDPLATNRPSLGTSHSRVRLLAAACVGVAVTLAWQSYGGPTRQMIASAVPQLAWLAPSPAMDAPSSRDSAVEQPSPPVVQAPAPQEASMQAASGASTGSEAAALPAPSAPSPELQQQLETMAHDLAAVRQSVDQLAAGQEQMARDIAKLHAAAPDTRRRVSALPPPAAPTPTLRKPVLPPEPAPQASTATLPPPPPPEPSFQAPVAPLPPTPEPPRPPMPVR